MRYDFNTPSIDYNAIRALSVSDKFALMKWAEYKIDRIRSSNPEVAEAYENTQNSMEVSEEIINTHNFDLFRFYKQLCDFINSDFLTICRKF